MQARINKDQLEIFRSQAVNLETDRLNPILTYIKIEIKGNECTLIKNNMKAFVVHIFNDDVGNEDCSFLVVENILYNFLLFSDEKNIEFTQTGNRIKISDQKSFVESPTDRAQDFPMPAIPSSASWTALSKITTLSIGISSKLIFNDEIAGPKSNVFVGQGHVAGTDGSIAFYQKITDVIPDVSLRREVAETVAKLGDCLYSCNRSYDFFKKGGTIYGYSIGEAQFFNLPPLFKFEDASPDAAFNIPKSLLVKFCSLCIQSINSKTSLASATFRTEGEKFILKMEDSDIMIQCNLPVGGTTLPFKFNPERMKVLLEAIPCETTYFYQGEKRYFITDLDKSFASVIMEII